MKYLITSFSFFLSFFLSTNLIAQCGTLYFGDIAVEEDGQFSVDVFLDEPQPFEMLEVIVSFNPAAGADILVDAVASQGALGISVADFSTNFNTRAKITGSNQNGLSNDYLATVFFEMKFGECLDGVEFDLTSYFYSTQPGGCGSNITTIDIEDEYCTPARSIGGLLETPIAGDAIDGVDINVNYDDDDILDFINEPSYYDIDVPTTNLEVFAEKEGDYTCGISTNDLKLLSKAILGTYSFSHASERIAADVNNSGQITTIDMIRIRRVILYPNTAEDQLHKDWQFIPTDDYYNINVSSFNSLLVPQGYSTSYQLPLGNNDNYGLGFVGIKIGDISDNCISSGRPVVTDVSKSASVIIPEQPVKKGAETLLPVYLSDFKDETFLSLSFASMANDLQLQGIVSAGLKDLDDDSYRINRSKNELDLIWFPYDNEAQTLSVDEPLFYLKVIAQTDLENISAALFLRDNDNSKQNKLGEDVSLTLQTAADASAVVLTGKIALEVYPNPSTSAYQLNFRAVAAAPATLELFDSKGQLVHQRSLITEVGLNILQVDALAKLPSGVYYQRLSTISQTVTTKLIHN